MHSLSQASSEAGAPTEVTTNLLPDGTAEFVGINPAAESTACTNSGATSTETATPGAALTAAAKAVAEAAAATEPPAPTAAVKATAEAAVSTQASAAVAASTALPATLPEAASTAGVPPVIVILVGVPGSGKSTFCAQLMARGSTSWVRVNQDSISNGKRGSKQQCLAAARAAVLAGHSCVVDRCHQDAQQRSDFIKLAVALHCEVGWFLFMKSSLSRVSRMHSSSTTSACLGQAENVLCSLCLCHQVCWMLTASTVPRQLFHQGHKWPLQACTNDCLSAEYKGHSESTSSRLTTSHSCTR